MAIEVEQKDIDDCFSELVKMSKSWKTPSWSAGNSLVTDELKRMQEEMIKQQKDRLDKDLDDILNL